MILGPHKTHANYLCAVMATKNVDNVVVGSDTENNAVIIHSLSNVGGNLVSPADNIVGAVGMGSNPIGKSIAINGFCKKIKLSTPGLGKYKECSSEEELTALKGTNKGKTNGSNIFILTPFMIKSLINAKTSDSDPLKLTPIVIDATTKVR